MLSSPLNNASVSNMSSRVQMRSARLCIIVFPLPNKLACSHLSTCSHANRERRVLRNAHCVGEGNWIPKWKHTKNAEIVFSQKSQKQKDNLCDYSRNSQRTRSARPQDEQLLFWSHALVWHGANLPCFKVALVALVLVALLHTLLKYREAILEYRIWKGKDWASNENVDSYVPTQIKPKQLPCCHNLTEELAC